MVSISKTFGQPGGPGEVKVHYLRDLHKGRQDIEIELPPPAKGGKGGISKESIDDSVSPFVHRGGAGGGRENDPLINAFIALAEKHKGTQNEPLCFLDPGHYKVEWPFDTSTATLVMISPGGSGGGGIGEVVRGENGEDGIPGACFIFPTYIHVQRPHESD